jgi:outer membrane protein assembly factor BamD (BamD/ComL family)
MSVSGISSSSSASTQGLFQEIQKEFQQLGKDLQSGNTTAAEADYVTLQEYLAERDADSTLQSPVQAQAQSTDPIAQAFNQLSQDLQSGNLAAAQSDYQTIVQDLPQQGTASSQGTATGSTSTQSGNSVAQEFAQLGKDLQAGNLTAAQADFATLQQELPQSSTASSTQSSNPIAAAFNQLSQDLQSGNLTAAQQDYSAIEQDFAAQGITQAAQGTQAHHHHDDDGSSGSNQVSKLLTELGQELQSGDLSSAKTTYASLEQDFQQFSQSGRQTAGTLFQSSSTSLSVSA